MSEGNESWKNKDDQEEDEEDLDETAYTTQKDAVLFAIEVSESMLAPPPHSDSKKPETDSPTAAAIKCAYQIMQQRIISHPKDMMGVLLFGTEKSKFEGKYDNDNGNITYPHCYLLTDLNVPSAVDVKALKAIVEDEGEAQSLLKPSEEPIDMPNLLFCANQIFTRGAPDFGSRRLFIITDKDDPHSANKALRSSATVRAKDLYDLGVTIELFPISHPDHKFDRTKFYDDIIYRDPEDDGGDLAMAPRDFKSVGADGINLLNDLISDINSKQFTKRALFSNMIFEIGPEFQISVKGYNILQPAKPAKQDWIYQGGETNQIVKPESARLSDDNATPVEKDEIKKAFRFGGTQILFTSEEQEKLRAFGKPGIRIIGFKPQSMLPFWASVKKSTFIYPSEEGFVGSSRVFSALWQKLVRDKIMGLAWFIARQNSSPTIVAILPSEECLSENTGLQLNPAGLWLYPLPFADDIREAPDQPTQVFSPDNLTNEMRTVIKQLQLPKGIYDPSKYPNPSLQWHYKILQAIALEEDIPETPEDKTVPKYRQVEKRAGEYIHNWGQLLEEAINVYRKERGSGAKHERADSDGPVKKKVKTEGLHNVGVDELKKMISTGKLAKHTVAELKDLLAAKGLSNSGKKPDLLERIEQWADEN
ncbi:ATP-dependent DNA helicase II subunit [Lachnellula subtilissima]|uniref:ATP-dependent DNA helicase II subunit 1 n=1 Tax=Lachnellula subtilissima TaxID=602034 RepID=A0A8H8RXK4_9HELO|nr:ATP-dependent DNA helicase II subunit [Lachnellula subtilissima]